MDEKRKEEETCELTPEEIDDMILEEQITSGEYDEEVSEYYFSNPDPYAKVESRPMMHQSETSSLMRTVTLL